MWFFQANFWRSQNLPLWSPGLWVRFLPSPHPSRSRTPPGFGYCKVTFDTQPQQCSPCWWVWCSVGHLTSLTCQSFGSGICIIYRTCLALLPRIINTSSQYMWLLERREWFWMSSVHHTISQSAEETYLAFVAHKKALELYMMKEKSKCYQCNLWARKQQSPKISTLNCKWRGKPK